MDAAYSVVDTGDERSLAVHIDVTSSSAIVTVDMHARLDALHEAVVDARGTLPGADADHQMEARVTSWRDGLADDDAVLEVRLDSPLDPAFWLQLTLPLAILR
jgi:hypothetical protein